MVEAVGNRTDPSLLSGNPPLITVITICYQSVEYLEHCIQSVVNQTSDNFEYLIIDGGSTDGSVDIIKKYEDHLAYWHSKPDRGLSHAFNQGLEHATGQWVIFLNSDDYFSSSTVLSKLSAVLNENEDKDVVFGQVQRVSREHEPVSLEVPMGQPFDWSEFLKRDTIPHPSSFTNMNFIRRVGPFDESYRIAIDYEFYLRGGRGLKVLFWPELVSHMREGGISRIHRRACLDEWIRALNHHHASSALFIAIYGNYLRLRLIVRDYLASLRGKGE